MAMILCFPSCALFNEPIPNLHFEPDPNLGDSLDILSIEGGKVIQREGNRITTRIDPGLARLEFEIEGRSRRSTFICVLEVGADIKSAFWGVFSVLSTNGSLWIPRKKGDTFVVYGEHASNDFLFGTSKSLLWLPDGDSTIRKVKPNTHVDFTIRNLSVTCQGKSGTSLTVLDSGILYTHPLPITLHARPGTHFLLLSGEKERRIELLDGASRRLELGRGPTTIKWYCPKLDEPEIEVVLDGDKTNSILDLSFSSGNDPND